MIEEVVGVSDTSSISCGNWAANKKINCYNFVFTIYYSHNIIINAILL